MNIRLLFYLVMAPLLLVLAACSGTQTFTPVARAGDTVTLAVGWQKTLLREHLTVTIIDANNSVTTYSPNDVHVRAIVNLYPDPASRAVVDTAAGLNTNGRTIGNLVNSFVTSTDAGADSDWWQTSIVLDLPTTLATGLATITLADSAGANLNPLSITITGPGGTPNLFNIYLQSGSTYSLLKSSNYPYALAQFEREPSSTVNFSNSNPVVPHSIQMQFSHTVGTGKAWIVNPRGDLKDIMWNDNNGVLTVMLMPTQGTSLNQILDFKFYISGGIAGLAQTSLKAYDINGAAVSGVTASVQ